jgi:hypothetical protein
MAVSQGAVLVAAVVGGKVVRLDGAGDGNQGGGTDVA